MSAPAIEALRNQVGRVVSESQSLVSEVAVGRARLDEARRRLGELEAGRKELEARLRDLEANSGTHSASIGIAGKIMISAAGGLAMTALAMLAWLIQRTID